MTTFIENFHWLRPEWLWLLLPAIVLVAASLRRQNTGGQWQSVIDPRLLPHLLHQSSSGQSRVARLALPLATLLGILSLAGPSWEKLPQPVEKKFDTLIIVADLTLSMHATDVKPSRLIRSRYKLLELLKQRVEGQTALIAYSADAHIVSPLTDDAKTIAALVPSLSPEIMPGIGSNALPAFQKANELASQARVSGGRILWITDEIRPAEFNDVRRELSGSPHELIIVGVGTTNGGPIPLPSGKFVKTTGGDIVTAKLNRGNLQKLALELGATYFDLQADNSDINFVLRDNLVAQKTQLNDEELQRTAKQEFDEWLDRGPWLAILLLPLLLPAFRRGAMLSLAFAVSGSLLLTLPANVVYAEGSAPSENLFQPPSPDTNSDSGFRWDDLWQTRDQQATNLLEQQDASAAAATFDDPQWRGVAEYLSGDYESAANSFTLDSGSSPSAKAGSAYNRGHALARAGKLQQALSAYDEALEQRPDFQNAHTAKKIVEQLLEQQKQQEQNQRQQEQQQNQQDQDQQNQDQQQNDQQQNDSTESNNTAEEQQNESHQSDSQQSNSQQNEEPQADEQQSESAEQGESSEQAQEQNLAASNPGEQDSEGLDSEQQQEAAQLDAEQQARLKQWLDQIPDDPSGLLRRKFQYERRLREREGTAVEQTEDGQIW